MQTWFQLRSRAAGNMSRRKMEVEAEEKEWVGVSMMRQQGGSGGGEGKGGTTITLSTAKNVTRMDRKVGDDHGSKER